MQIGTWVRAAGTFQFLIRFIAQGVVKDGDGFRSDVQRLVLSGMAGKPMVPVSSPNATVGGRLARTIIELPASPLESTICTAGPHPRDAIAQAGAIGHHAGHDI